MDPHSARNQRQHDLILIKHSSIGEQHHESNKCRSLGDSKLQHPNHNHHTAHTPPSSEAASRLGSFYTFQSVVRPTKNISKEIIPQTEHRQKPKAHDKHNLVESKYSPTKVTKPSLTRLTYSNSVYFKDNNDEYHYNEGADPDYFSLFDKFDGREVVSESHRHIIKHGSEHVNDISSKKTVANTQTQSSRHKDSSHFKLRTQSMNVEHATSNLSEAEGKLSPHKQQLTVASEDGESSKVLSWRHSFVDCSKSSNESSKYLRTQTDDSNSENIRTNCINRPVTSRRSRHESEISTTNLAKYKTNSSKVESTSHQGNASMPFSLHLSLPDISSESHGRMTKSGRDRAFKVSFEHLFEPENVKTKVKSVWNNIKFGWTFKSKSSFKYDSPLFMLGKCYHRRKDDPSPEPEDQFLQDFVSRIWLTYRSNFYPIPGTKLSTDCGWGCMLRSGQMLIAQCLVTHFLGRDWRLYNKQTATESVFYREIIRWFSDPLDAPSDKTPFCLHHLTNFGRAYNKDPGDWYGPASVAYIFRDTFIKVSHSVPILSQLCLYVAQDCTVYIEDVNNLCTQKHRSESLSSSSECDSGASKPNQKAQSDKWLRSVIILIPMRLGGEVTNEIYTPCVQSLLSHNNCMGIIGGRPKHSLYFLGWQDKKLIYLDPHLCREAVDTTVTDFKIETFHCMTPRKLAIKKMDPSCTVGFYIKDADDFQHFVQEVKEFISPPKQKGIYPLFTFSNGCQCESTFSHSQSAKDKRVRVTHYRVDQYGRKTLSGESEEFVML